MRIAFLTTGDPFNRQSGSGAFYYMLQSLQKHCGDVLSLCLLPTRANLPGRVFNKATSLICKRRFAYDISFSLARRYACIASRFLQNNPCDVIVAPRATVSTALLRTDIPVILIEDATFALLYNYYPHYSHLWPGSTKTAHMITSQAFRRAAVLVFSSLWAAQSAEKDYGVSVGKIQIIPFGANIEFVPAQQVVATKSRSSCCTLLFVGLDWQRKGGAIALETLYCLEALGIAAKLIVCGCRPPHITARSGLQVIPYLNSNDPRQRAALADLYAQADFLLLPTRSDCTPCVFCEANAFGLPVVTADTGGVTCVIKSGINGLVLPYQARGEAYAAAIAHVFGDEQLYMALRRSSRAMFEACLNWDAWGSSMRALLQQRICTRSK